MGEQGRALDKVVLDASALLATLLSEPGGDEVEKLLLDPDQSAVMSAVNWCEVFDRLLRDGMTESQVDELLGGLHAEIIDFTRDQAMIAAGYRIAAPWLSFGDRAWLALAATLDATAWTTDKLWLRANLPVRMKFLR
jgi:ribonuclease VapC